MVKILESVDHNLIFQDNLTTEYSESLNYQHIIGNLVGINLLETMFIEYQIDNVI